MPTSQNSRLIEALLPESALLTDRSLTDHLVIAARYGRLIRYYDGKDQPAGDWAQFFEQEAMVQYALLAKVDLEERREQCGGWLRQLPVDEPAASGAPPGLDHLTAAAVRNSFGFLFEVFRTVDDSRAFFVSRPAELAFHEKLVHLAGSLAPCRRATAELWAQFRRRDPDAARLLEEEQRELGPGARETDRGAESPAEAEPWDAFVRGLHNNLWMAWEARKALGAAALARLNELIEAPRGLSPHFALYLAFARQFGEVQAHLNEVSRRHLDFFYRDVLREAPRPAISDRVWLAVETRPTDPLAILTLPPGTTIQAPPAGAALPVTFATESALELSGCRIRRQVVLRLRSPSRSAAPVAGEPASLPSPPQAPESRSAVPMEAPEPAMGFAIASPYLVLRDGQRDVGLVVDLAPPPGASTADTSGTVPTSGHTAEINPPPCRVIYSGPDGWVTLPPRRIKSLTLRYADGNVPEAWELQLELTPGDPPLTDFDPARLPGEFAPGLPVLQVLFPRPLEAFCGNPMQVPLDVAQAFATARVRQVRITTTVSEHTPSVMYTPSGRAPAKGPFPPFGGQPQVGGAVVAGAPELFRKVISELSVQIEWSNLPDARRFPSGLRSYYREYIQVAPQAGLLSLSEGESAMLADTSKLFQSDAYLVTLEAFADAQWQACPTADGEPLPLLASDASGRLSPKSVLQASGAMPWEARPAPLMPTDLEYGAQTRTGFLRLKFLAPGYAFGHQAFPRVAAAVAAHNLRPAEDGATLETAATGSSGTAGRSLPPGPASAPTGGSKVTSLPHDLFAALKRAGPPPGNIAELARRGGSSMSELVEKLQQLNGKVFARVSGLEEELARLLKPIRDELAGPHVAQLHAQVLGWFEQLLAQQQRIVSAVHALPLVPSPGLLDRLFHWGASATAFRLPESLFAALAASPVIPPPLLAVLQALKLAPAGYANLLSVLKGVRFKSAEDLNVKLLATLPQVRPASAGADLNALLLHTHEWFGQLTGSPPSAPTDDGITPASAVGRALPAPNVPLTLMAERLTLGYQAQGTLGAGTPPEAGRWYQVHPVITQAVELGEDAGPTLLPEAAEGTWLYLSFDRVLAEQHLSLLLLPPAAGSASGPGAASAPSWALLHEGQWDNELGAAAVRDATDGLRRAGLIEIQLPRETAAETAAPWPGRCWLRVGFPTQPDYCLDGLGLLPQAVAARRVTSPEATGPAAAAVGACELPPDSLSQLNTLDSRVRAVLAKVRQPLTSFGGRPAETEREFHVRLSERLRHKGRAWTAWDYERLLLQEFPEVFSAECLTPDAGAPGLAPGSVLLIVIPTLKEPPAALPPGFTARQLEDMATWLQSRASPHVTVRVENPAYVRLGVSATVGFKAVGAATTLLERLDEDVRQHLSPWIYCQSAVRLPEKTVAQGAVARFVASLHYVDRVRELELHRLDAPGGTPVGAPPVTRLGLSVAPQHPREYFVTADRHHWTLAEPASPR